MLQNPSSDKVEKDDAVFLPMCKDRAKRSETYGAPL
jgi:hypothetical protein